MGMDQRIGNNSHTMRIIALLICSVILSASGDDPQNLDPTFEFNYISSDIYVGSESVGSFNGTIHNVSSGNITIAVVRRVNALPAEWTSSICLGEICYNESIDSVSIQLGAGDSAACGILAWISGAGTGTVQLDLFDLDSDEHVFVDVNFYAGTVELKEEDMEPDQFTLYPAFPNPFNPVTTLRYDLPVDGMVNITIYDMMGRIVKNLLNDQQTRGYRSVKWDATDNTGDRVSSGLYLYTIQAGQFNQTKKVVFLK